MKKTCALIMTTGDRVEYLDASIASCRGLIHHHDPDIETDIYLLSYPDVRVDNESIHRLCIDRHDVHADLIQIFPKSKQLVRNYATDPELVARVTLGHVILCGLIPDALFRNRQVFEKYDFVLKSRSDLVFGFEEFEFDPRKEVLTFECFWGGCRYDRDFTNDHIVFGEAKDVLDITAYPLDHCMLSRFWNPEHYMTHLFSMSDKAKREISTDRYYLLSKDRRCRKWIGFPLEKMTTKDVQFLTSMGIHVEELEFENEWE